MEEIWKDIKEYQGLYQISNLGRIKNVKRNRIKKQTINKDGYYITKLSKNNKKKTYLIHRLVAEAFLNYNNFNFTKEEYNKEFFKTDLVVNHKDENKLNNNVDNLEWCTNLYNIKYSYKSKKRRTKDKLYNYMKENNIDNNTINIVMNYFK